MIKLGQVQIRKTLGQTAEEWKVRAEKAVLAYDHFIEKTATIQNQEAIDGITEWIGRADMPGSPEERRIAVGMDLDESKASEAVYGTDMATQRVKQLEDMVLQFEARVDSALQTYGSLPAPSGAGSRTEEVSATMLCITGGIGLLGLIVIPILLE